jgi:RND family efflux transporter MFP subunit
MMNSDFRACFKIRLRPSLAGWRNPRGIIPAFLSGGLLVSGIWLVLLGSVAPAAPGPGPAEGNVASGITEAICDVTLSASVPGIVNVWKFKEGDFVQQGDVIIELDKVLEELEAARRKLVMENRQADWEALQTLVKKSSISVKKEELERAETEYRIAVVEHDIAVEQLRRRSITAPHAGIVVELMRRPGEACQPYQPLIRLVDTRQCYFISNIEGKAAERLSLGQSVKLEIECGSKPTVVQGKIAFLSPVVDPASGLRKVKVLFENAEGKVHPGVAGKMEVE